MTKTERRFFTSLQEANVERDKEWNAGGKIDLHYRVSELFGETGEAANVMKKLDRERLGMVGSRSSLKDLEDELSDVIICSYLLSMHVGIDIEYHLLRNSIWPGKFNSMSHAAMMMGARAGFVCAFVATHKTPFSLLDERMLGEKIAALIAMVKGIARNYNLNLEDRIIDKFNASSEKNGLSVFLKKE